MLITFSNALTGEVGPTIGPFVYVTLTYTLLRAGDASGDAKGFANYNPSRGMWIYAECEYTDVDVHTEGNDA